MEIQTIYENYNLVTTNHLDEFLAFSEDYIEDQTAHYACAISALYACAAYYGALNFADVSGAYAAFGKITEGMDIVNKIAETATDYSDRPLEPQRMKTVTVEIRRNSCGDEILKQ